MLWGSVMTATTRMRPPQRGQVSKSTAPPCTPPPCAATSPSASGSRYRPWVERLKRTLGQRRQWLGSAVALGTTKGRRLAAAARTPK